MDRIIRWGIVGTGNMARRFARALQATPGNRLIAVTSRSRDRSRSFGRELGVAHCHEGVAEIARDPEVDVVYVATPHTCHHDDTLACFTGGKHVLCEKPLALNAREARAMFECAARKKLFLMEAMWTRFLPPIVKALELVQAGALGEIQFLHADLGFDLPFAPEGRVFNRNLAGGALLDVAVYPIALAAALLGEPRTIAGRAAMGSSGVDEHNSITLEFDHGRVASIFSSIRLETPRQAVLVGTRGTLQMQHDWWKGAPFEVRLPEGAQVYAIPVLGTGYEYEIDEVRKCLLTGQIESLLMPGEASLRVLRITDALRKRWQLLYPGDEQMI